MRLTIVPIDKKVGVNGLFFGDLNLATCDIPPNIHALQWYETEGEVEFINNPDRTKPQNELISELPAWANNCVTVFNNQVAANQASQEEAQARVSQNQPTTTGTQTI
jgi:hypothetical protein